MMTQFTIKIAAGILALSFATSPALAHCPSHETADASDAASHTMHSETVEQSGIALSGGSSRAMLAGQKVGGGYISIENKTDKDDELISVSSTVAGRMEIHEMAMEGDVMKMRKLSAPLVIKAGTTETLKSGGNHLMFFDVKKPFEQGEQIPVTFTFKNAGAVEAKLSVAKAGKAASHDSH